MDLGRNVDHFRSRSTLCSFHHQQLAVRTILVHRSHQFISPTTHHQSSTRLNLRALDLIHSPRPYMSSHGPLGSAHAAGAHSGNNLRTATPPPTSTSPAPPPTAPTPTNAVKPTLQGVRLKQRKRQVQASAKFDPESELARSLCARTMASN